MGTKPSTPARQREVLIAADRARLPGLLTEPAGAAGIVVFAHGSGSSHRSPRNLQVARALAAAGLATLLFDLLSDEEAADRRNVFDISLLATRLEAATRRLEEDPALRELPLGYFGASTGAAAALTAAARNSTVAAVVSRGGRPDLAAPFLSEVRAPTLLIVGGADTTVLELNRQVLEQLECEAELRVVPGAGHLFEEPGALEEVTRLTRDWFLRYVPAAGRSRDATPPHAPPA
ncbi:MAG: dienelactone hydrolase family protein [Gaiellaceae bacterium]